MLIVGVTGGIGTGKSEVSRILGELGARVIDADQVGHETYRPHSRTWQEVVTAFGESILEPTGEINRKRLGAIVFSDPAALDSLNSIMWPHMCERIGEQIERYREEGAKVVVVEAALLIEAGWDSLVDEIWVTWSPEHVVVDRLRRGDGFERPNGLSEDEIGSRMRAQISFEDRRAHAHAVVRNAGTKDELREEVESLWGSRVKGKVR